MTEHDEQLSWRETYFVLLSQRERPTLSQVEAAILEASDRLQVENLEANEEGLFTSALVLAPEDNAAMEISYETGETVVEQSIELASRMRQQITDQQRDQLLRSDARLDVMHFERVVDGEGEEEMPLEDEDDLEFEALDPASLITVLEALAQLTGGLAIDPVAEEIMVV